MMASVQPAIVPRSLMHREFSAQANFGAAKVKRSGRSQKLPMLYMGLTR